MLLFLFSLKRKGRKEMGMKRKEEERRGKKKKERKEQKRKKKIPNPNQHAITPVKETSTFSKST